MKAYSAIALSLLVGAAAGAAAVQSLHAQARAPAYVVAEIDVTNQDAYVKEYAPIAGKAIQDGGGKYLARGGKTVSFDGDLPKSRITMIAFENMDKARAVFEGPAYREARKIGEKYAKFRIYAIEGVSP
jgi:uncharacterized protein (DUF1330 family)